MSDVPILLPDSREKRRRDKKNNAHFWRAIKYLHPYRALVGVSIVAAFFVGLAMTGGLGTMLPIVRVLINGDTMPTWVDRAIVDQRLGVTLNDNAGQSKLVLVGVTNDKPAALAGYAFDDDLIGDRPPTQLLHEMSDPDRSAITLHVPGEPDRTIAMLPVKWHMALARQYAARLPTNPVWAIGIIFALLTSMALVGNIIRFFQEYLSSKAAISAVNDIRRRLYDHVLRVPLSHFGEQGTSDVTSRLVQDSASLTDGFKQVLGQTIQEPIKMAFSLGLALWASWLLTIFIIGFTPVLAIVVRKFGKKMYRASKRQLQESSAMLGQLEATMTGIRVVKAAGAERFERRRYGKIMAGLITQQLRLARIDAFNTPVMEMLLLVATGFIVLFGAYLVLISHNHHLDSGKFIVVMAALMMLADSLRKISKVGNAIQVSNAAAARIFEAMDLPVEQESVSRQGIAKLRPIRSEIRFEGVGFTYPGATMPALSGVSLVVPKGRCVAIVGRNGSGKTTLLALLPRFYHAQAGRITIDGSDIRKVTLRSLRKQISVVTQDSVIFPGTIAQNIAYGHPLASRLDHDTPAIQALRAEIESAARRAFAHDFIVEKARGYDTLLGEMGGALSGGQKQRLCIARAVLRRTPILILDEATSQVDAESERLIQQAIDSLIHEGPRTTFVIAHRFSTIQSADVIVVMERGQIVGQGKHEQLLSGCAVYQQLYERQLFAAPV